MTFTAPAALVLLLTIPFVIYLGWPRVAFRRGRDIASLILRSLIILLLVLALAGTQVVRAAGKLAVVFLIDASDSVGQQAQEAQLNFLREALEGMSPDDEAAIVVFGANALVERPMSTTREISPLRSTPITSNTDLEEAIGLGMALFPADAAKRMVILSDGQATVGDAEAAARRAAATGIEISYVPFRRAPTPEVLMSDVRVPDSVSAGQQFDLSMTIEAEEATDATIQVFADGAVIHTQDVPLLQGTNNYTLPLTAGDTGFTDFQVLVTPADGDGFYQNNQLSAFSRVIGPPRVLVVSSDDEESRYLVDALGELGVTVDQVRPSQLPIGIPALEDYDSIVLANVPASQLSTRRMANLNTYVRDLGGGLVVVGGPRSYGPGGYFQTPLEEILPVESQIRDQQRLPQLTITYVIDRSGSMSNVGPSGVSNLELAKEAIIRSVDFLQPTDRAGVVSFDVDGFWVADIQPVFDRIGLQTRIATLQAGGGTDIMAGMRLAAEALQTDPSERKHIILLTDGGAEPTGLVELAQELYENNDVTTSVIAIGAGAASFLEDMAQAGGGNYHAVDVVESIPTIFTQETVLATRSYILEEEFVPAISANSPILNNINSAPPLLGYVATTPRQTAQVILRGPEPYRDPILASWQYGLGRVVAFTSDGTARWASNWVTWDGFAQFWNQAVQWTITESASNNVEARVIMEGEQARVTVDARDEEGDFLNGLALSARVVSPEGEAVSVPLQQVAPGRYEAAFVPDAEGAYFIRLAGGDEQGISVNQTTGWVMSYSPEYSLTAPAGNLLQELASLTGGQSLADSPNEVFAHNLTSQAALNPIWQHLLLAALLLLPFDIAVRRLLVTRSDLVRLRNWIFGEQQAVPATSERMSTLFDAKARAQKTLTTEASAPVQPESTTAALRARRAARRSGAETAPKVEIPSPRQTTRTSTPSSSRTAPHVEGSNIAGELLKRRKDRD
ncbi:MAG TPA: VWA domain-containing protein [Oceanobacillus sp.]|nr:VWA domain-containing protein [Oceanobacillus sp.]